MEAISFRGGHPLRSADTIIDLYTDKGLVEKSRYIAPNEAVFSRSKYRKCEIRLISKVAVFRPESVCENRRETHISEGWQKLEQ
jgi:hypothetical protein